MKSFRFQTSDLRSGMEQNSNDFLHIILYVRKHFGEDDIYRIDVSILVLIYCSD